MALARFGIINGRKVALGEIVDPLRPSLLDDFSADALDRAGFLRIAEKIVSESELTESDLSSLLGEAGLPVLMKLISLKRKSTFTPTVTPAVVLPLRLWLEFDSDLLKVAGLAYQFLSEIPHANVSVSFDQIDLNRLTPNVISFFKAISHSRPGISMVGPRIEEIVSYLHRKSPAKNRDVSSDQLRLVLNRLKAAGFSRLMAFSSDQYLELASEAGFSNSFVTDLDKFPSSAELASELVLIKQRASVKRWVDVWSPGTRVSRPPALKDDPVSDFRILRAMAVAALYFDGSPQVRASSRYLSSEAILFARQLGANDLGFGAFDAFTKRTLKLRPYDELEEVVQQH